MNNKGEVSILGVYLFLVVIFLLVSFTPAFKTSFNILKQSDYLNCPGYDKDASGVVGDHVLDYNATQEAAWGSNDIGCVGAANPGLSLLVVTVFLGGLTMLFKSRQNDLVSQGI